MQMVFVSTSQCLTLRDLSDKILGTREKRRRVFSCHRSTTHSHLTRGRSMRAAPLSDLASLWKSTHTRKLRGAGGTTLLVLRWWSVGAP